MLANAIIHVGIFSALITAISVPLGLYMARVFAGERTMLDPVQTCWLTGWVVIMGPLIVLVVETDTDGSSTLVAVIVFAASSVIHMASPWQP